MTEAANIVKVAGTLDDYDTGLKQIEQDFKGILIPDKTCLAGIIDLNDPDFKNYELKRVFHNIYAEGTYTRVYTNEYSQKNSKRNILDLSTGHLHFNIICDKAGNERLNAFYNDR